MIVRKLRLKKGWSQEQLAQISGLNVRTIQRIERGHSASLESKKSLAAAFEVQLSTFEKPSSEVSNEVTKKTENEAIMKHTETAAIDETVIEELKSDEKQAIEYARGIKEFYNHLFFYVVFASVIALVKGFDDNVVVWGLIGWTVGVIIHGLNAYELINIFNANWERKIVEKKLGRKL